jgi:spermidine synthase
MIPWVHLDTAVVPGDGTPLKLMQRGHEFSIMTGATELMNSRLSGSEEVLAERSCALIADRAKPRILIGGLGMGFTLRAALKALKTESEIVVAELVPAVVAWARGPLQPIYGESLGDPRVTIIERDVGAVIAAAPGRYDAILLDVDNGPDGLTRDANEGLYSFAGLERARRALTKNGVLAVWSSAPDAGFTRRLKSSGFAVEEVKVRARRSRGARHLIWLATRTD